MSNLLARGAAWQAARLKEIASISVTLRRRGYADVSGVLVTPGTTAIEEIMGDGSSMRSQSRDYLIAVSDYVFGGVECEPQDGDLIIETAGGIERHYQLLPFGGERCSRPSDQSRVMWRCHTKLVQRSPTRQLTENQLRALLGLLPVIGTDGFDENELRHMAGIVSTAA